MIQQTSDTLFQVPEELQVSSEDAITILNNLPKAEDGNYYVDAVFEGGGVKGTAFLGALRCFADVGIQFRKVAGTSAGAITAAMIAAGFSVDQLEKIIGLLDYEGEFLSEKTSWLIHNGSPSDDLKNFGCLMGRLLLAREDGQYSSNPFKRWLEQHLKDTLPTFSQFSDTNQANLKWYQKRDLQVVVSDISRKEMQVLPKDLSRYGYDAETFPVAEAVRLSMSIPLFFEPGLLKDSTIVDGGILSNFPLWIYDAKPNQEPCCPTFGFRLVEKDPDPEPIKGALGIMQAMFATMQVARDSHHIRENDQGRVINIPTTVHVGHEIKQISATQFDLTTEDKQQLYLSGYKAAKAFLQQWSWEAHLQQRGFGKANVQPAPAKMQPVA